MQRSGALRVFQAALALGAMGLGAVLGAEPANAPGGLPEGTIAVVGAETISVEQFRAEMERRAHGLPGQFVTPEQRRALLDEMIEHRALVAAARAEGFDRRLDVVAAFEKILVARYRQDRLEPELDSATVDDWEVESFYEQHKYDYAVPERYRAAIIRIGLPKTATEDDWKAAERRAELALDEARELDPGTTHFGPVAVRYSEDRASRYRGGVIGWLTRDLAHRSSWPPEVVEAIFALEQPGQIAPMLRAEDGLYLIRLVDREEQRTRSLTALEDGFRNQILRAKRRELHDGFIESLLSGIGLRVNEPLLDSIEPPESSATTENRPPALPAG